MEKKPVIGFVGQGFIGKSYADDYERRGYEVIRYALEEPYRQNKDRIRKCDIVFVAVPTPTTPKGFDYSIVRGALALVKPGATAVIKSTILPGTTEALQDKFPKLFVMHSPEFLVARSASADAAKPERNIVGIPKNVKSFRDRALLVMETFPNAPFERIVPAREAELVKYGGNLFLYLKVLYANLMYETAEAVGADYETIREVIAADPRIGPSHLQVLHDSGHKGAKKGRGAGGLCFIKDIAAFSDLYAKKVRDVRGSALLQSAIEKNIHLLVESGKDLDLLEGVHGQKALKGTKAKRSATKKRR